MSARPQYSTLPVWWEISVVAMMALLPALRSALVALFVHQPEPIRLPYWLDTLDACVAYAPEAFLVLYLIYRSGEQWSAFGIVVPRLGDVLIGVVLVLVPELIWWLKSALAAPISSGTESYSPIAQSSLDYVLLVVRYGSIAFVEELVYRAYLITRLEHVIRLESVWQKRLLAVAIPAILFGFSHLYDGFWGVTSALIGGFLWGFWFQYSRRLWPLVIGHMLYDIRVESFYWNM